MNSAYPTDDWQGGAAEAYGAANRDQADRTASLAVLDRGVHTVIAREAYQIAFHRDTLDDMSNYLGDLSYITWSIALIPGVGRALKAAVELTAVKSALSVCGFELYMLSQETGENAQELQQLAGEYSALAQRKVAPPDLDDVPPLGDGSPESVPTDSGEPGRPASDGGPGWSSPPPRGSSARDPLGAPAPASSAPAAAQHDTTALPPERPGAAAEPTAPPAMPMEAMSGVASAFGAVGGMIGSMVAPLAAALTGVAGAAAQSLSTLTSAGGAEAGDEVDPTGLDEDADRSPDDDGNGDHPTRDGAAAGETGAGGDDVPPATGAESATPDPPPADEPQSEPQSAPPAATRPPQ